MSGDSARPILLITNDLGPRAGGIETFILGLLSQLDGSQILIYTSSQEGDKNFDEALLRDYGVIVFRDKSKILLPTPRVFAAVSALADQYRVNTIWYGATAPLAWLAPFFKRRGAYKQIGMTHGHEVWWARVWPFNWALRRMGNALDVITYLGEFTHSAIRPAFGSHPRYVRIAPGIATDHFRPLRETDGTDRLRTKLGLADKKVIISVGRLVHRKGQDRIIQALPRIREEIENAEVVLIGVGPYEQHLRELAKKLQVEKYVHFLGRLQYAELPQYIAIGDLFVMPSRSRFFGLEVEGLGIVYLEASACGLPVIAGKSGGAPDAIKEGVTGCAVDGNSVPALAQRTIELLRNEKEMRRMGDAGREWTVQEWNWSLWGERFKELLLSPKK